MAVLWILVVFIGIVAAQCPGSYSNGEVAGIAVGVAFATLALCLIAIGLYLLFKRKQANKDGKHGKSYFSKISLLNFKKFSTMYIVYHGICAAGGLLVESLPVVLKILGSNPGLEAQEFSKFTFISRN